jgi:hypothetical protein
MGQVQKEQLAICKLPSVLLAQIPHPTRHMNMFSKVCLQALTSVECAAL